MYSDVETFTLDEVDSRERVDRWQEILSTTHVPFAVQSPKRDHSHPFRAGMRLRRVDDITIFDTYSDLCRGRRTRRDVRTNPGEFVQLTIPLDGFRLTVPLDGREAVGLDDHVTVAPGTMLFSRHDRPWNLDMKDAARVRTVLIPQESFEAAAGRSFTFPIRVFTTAEPTVKLLASHLAALQAISGSLPGTAATAARNATLELLIGASRSQLPVGSPATLVALRHSIERWIDGRLSVGTSDRDLTAAAAAAAHSISLRTLHRAFADGDTFGSVVRHRRMQRARRDLGDPSATIQSIATRWGFADASHFCRAFKSLYGQTPTDYRIMVGRNAAGT